MTYYRSTKHEDEKWHWLYNKQVNNQEICKYRKNFSKTSNTQIKNRKTTVGIVTGVRTNGREFRRANI